MYTVTFYNNKSPNNSIAKNIEQIAQYTNVVFKQSTDLYNIELILTNKANMKDCNYFLISGINRYYYIDSFEFAEQRLIIRGHVDVLQTYRTQIEKCKIVVERNEEKSFAYLNDSELPIECRETKIMLEFPNEPLKKSQENILVVAGGVT